jgi:hypothetical protein
MRRTVMRRFPASSLGRVMAGLDPAIQTPMAELALGAAHGLANFGATRLDGRVKPGHDAAGVKAERAA